MMTLVLSTGVGIVSYIVSVVKIEFKELTRLGHKLFHALVWIMCKLSPDVVQTVFSDINVNVTGHERNTYPPVVEHYT